MTNDSHCYERVDPYPLECYEIRATVYAQSRLAVADWLRQTTSVYVEECVVNVVK